LACRYFVESGNTVSFPLQFEAISSGIPISAISLQREAGNAGNNQSLNV
jgi:hypothetical protein